jgi:hypothetical protein
MDRTEILLMKRKLNTLNVVAKRLLDGVTWKSTGGQQIGHLAVRGIVLFLKTLLDKIMCENRYIT